MITSLLGKKHRSVHPARMGARISPYWEDLTREHGFEDLKIEGTLPAELNGTLYRTGPALTQRFGQPYHHVFEGDGAVAAIRMAGGRAQGAHKLLRGQGFVEEERAGRPLYQSAAPRYRHFLNLLTGRGKNTGNTNVMAWHGSLYGLMENAKPLAFDRELDTIGESTLGGIVTGTFSAHPHRVVNRRATYNFGMRFGRQTTLSLYELPWSGTARCITEMPLDHPVMLHDFMATEQHLVFLVSPMRVVIRRAILGNMDFDDLFEWVPEAGTEVIVVPIDQPERRRRFHVDPFFQIHLAGGFDEPEAVSVDIMAYPDSSALQRNVADIDEPPACGTLTRIRIPHGAERIEKERLAETQFEFGKLDPRCEGGRYGHVYGLSADESHRFGLVHVDLETGREHCFKAPEGEYLSEPLFVPRSVDAAEGDGFLTTIVYRAKTHTSHLAIFDARRLDDGPVARAHFDHHIPAQFHGTYVPAGEFDG